jgi:general secretion pathway protein G
MRNHSTARRGFTVAELITVVAVIAILASMALPVISFGIRRQKEIELRARLRRITDAVDRYHDLRLTPPPNGIKAAPDSGQDTYPKDLDELVKPIELGNGKFVRLLRERDLIDPMTGKSEWTILSSGSEPGGSTVVSADNVWEVHSKSTALALDGKTHYNEW